MGASQSSPIFEVLPSPSILLRAEDVSLEAGDASVLELYMLVCMNRLESKEKISYNFISVMKEYRAIQDAYKTSDNYAQKVCLRAFEHLLELELIGFADKGWNQSIEYRPLRLLISSRELYDGLKLNTSCPVILQKLFDHETYN